jgi:predicted restriction endonuclease
MPCAICGHSRTEEAHVKPRETFGNSEDDKTLNIILLCPIHHGEFDDGHIGIVPDKSGFLVQQGDSIIFAPSTANIHNLKDKYIEERNQTCQIKLRLRLGLVASASYLRMDF